MNHERPVDVDEDREPKAAPSRRRARILSLSYGIVVAGLLAMSLRTAFDADLSKGQVAMYCLLTPLLLAMQAALWRLEILAAHDPRPRGRVAVIATCAGVSIALSALFVISALSPDGAAFGILACIVFALFLRTWE